MDEDVTRTGPGRLRSLWYMATLAFRADPLRATAAVVTAVVQACGQISTSFFISRLIGAIVDGDADRAIRFALAVALVGALSLAASLTRLDLRFRMEEATALMIDRELIALSAGIPGLDHHERPEHLDRLELLRNEKEALSGSVAALIENAAVVGGILTSTGLLLSVHPALVLLPVFGVPSVFVSAKVRGWWQKAQEESAERLRLSNHLYDLATTGPPAKELRVFGLRSEIESRFDGLVLSINDEFDRLNVRSMIASTLGWCVFAVGYVGAIAFVALRAVDGHAGPEDVVLVISLAAQVNQQVSSVYWMVGWLFDTLKTVGRYLQLVDDAAAAVPKISDPVTAPDRLTHGIELVGVTFRYPGTDEDVLRGVDLHLAAGATVAVVGDNGAGKSTLIKLLSRFYEPTEGEIRVDGVDLSRITAAQWRARMSAGFQDFARLELLARQTVGVGHLPAIDDEVVVRDALDRASATDFVDGLPEGFETQLGRSFEGGLELSGGQWQKLALGRAMMRERPLLLVLDEPTAALDADTEHALFERYSGAARTLAAETGGITVLVSHRFSTVRMADVIVVVGDGRVTECGSHDELMAVGGTYAELYEMQAKAYR